MTAEELQQIEDFAAALMSPREICIIMQLSWNEHQDHFKNPEHPLFQAYNRGKFKTIATAKQFIIKLANEGSSAAQQMVQDFIAELKTAEENEIH